MTDFTPGRRAVLAGTGALLTAPALAQQVPFSTGTDKPSLRAPANAADCHFHIYNDKYPPAPGSLPAPKRLG